VTLLESTLAPRVGKEYRVEIDWSTLSFHDGKPAGVIFGHPSDGWILRDDVGSPTHRTFR
jgi:hypothetical protein